MATYTDDFVRGDSADLGTNWTVSAGDAWRILNNAAWPNGTGNWGAEHWNANTVTDAQWAQITHAEVETIADAGLGPAIRMADAADTMYFLRINTSAAQEVGLFKRVTGTETQLGSFYTAGATPNTSMVFRIEAEGDTIRAKVDGATVITQTDGSITSGRIGVAGVINNNCNLTPWSGGDLDVGPPVLGPALQFVRSNVRW